MQRRTVVGTRSSLLWIALFVGALFLLTLGTKFLVGKYLPALARQTALALFVEILAASFITMLLTYLLPSVIRRAISWSILSVPRVSRRILDRVRPVKIDLGSLEEGITLQQVIRVPGLVGGGTKLWLGRNNPWLKPSKHVDAVKSSAVVIKVDTKDLREGAHRVWMIARSGWHIQVLAVNLTIVEKERPAWMEGTGVRLKEQYKDLLMAEGISGLAIAREDQVKIADFIMNFNAGRFILSGYGRFGGTTIVEEILDAVKKAPGTPPQGKGVLLVVRLDLDKMSQPEDLLDCFVRELYWEIKDQKQNRQLVKRLRAETGQDKRLQRLGKEKEEREFSLTMSPIPDVKVSFASLEFSLTSPLKATLSRRAVLSKAAGDSMYGTSAFVDDILQLLFDPQRDTKALAKVFGGLLHKSLPNNRIVIIMDKVNSVAAIQLMDRMRLLDDARVVYLAIVDKNQMDRWNPGDFKQLETKFRFRICYVPLLSEESDRFMDHLCNETLDEKHVASLNEEAERRLNILKKHAAFVGKGAPGDIVWEFFSPQYWYFWRSHATRPGQWYLRLDKLPCLDVMRRHAELQGILEESWPQIVSAIIPKGWTKEQTDRIKRGVYELAEWMESKTRFTRSECITSSTTCETLSLLEPELRRDLSVKLIDILHSSNALRSEGEIYTTLDALPQEESSSADVSVQRVKTNPSDFRAKLRQDLAEYFGEEELRTLCFDMALDYESLPAQGKAGKAREIVAQVERNGAITKLIEQCRLLRPNVQWMGMPEMNSDVTTFPGDSVPERLPADK